MPALYRRSFFIKIRLLVALFLILDRKSTRLNSSHDQISYAVFCLKKKKIHTDPPAQRQEEGMHGTRYHDYHDGFIPKSPDPTRHVRAMLEPESSVQRGGYSRLDHA